MYGGPRDKRTQRISDIYPFRLETVHQVLRPGKEIIGEQVSLASRYEGK